MGFAKPQTPPPQRPPVFELPRIDIDENLDAEKFLTCESLIASTASPTEPGGRYVAVQIDTDEDLASADAISDLGLSGKAAFDIEERRG
jgi:hypothetical protein